MVLYGNRAVPTEMSHQIMQYSCSECGTILKKMAEDSYQDLFIANTQEECPKCGYALLKTLKKEWNEVQLKELCNNKNNAQSLSLQSLVSPSLKFQSAYEEFIGRFTFGIKALDSPTLLNLKTGDTLGIIGNGSNNRNYTNILMTRLSIRSLLSKRQGGVGSPYVITVDTGNSLDFYQYVNFARHYCLDIKEILQRILVSRAFTVYQLADLIINELPKIIEQFDTRLVVVSDLLHMFIHDPNVDRKEAIYLIKEIVSAIRKISMSSSSPRQILCVVSWNHHHQSSYNDILLSKLDKHIEITRITSRRKRLPSSLSPSSIKVKVSNNKDVKCNSNNNSNNNNNYLLPIRDLCLIQQR
jgi:DNA-directed RNA polymerase subunit RPC12/RpoP